LVALAEFSELANFLHAAVFSGVVVEGGRLGFLFERRLSNHETRDGN
jgi:hypothetical protein